MNQHPAHHIEAQAGAFAPRTVSEIDHLSEGFGQAWAHLSVVESRLQLVLRMPGILGSDMGGRLERRLAEIRDAKDLLDSAIRGTKHEIERVAP